MALAKPAAPLSNPLPAPLSNPFLPAPPAAALAPPPPPPPKPSILAPLEAMFLNIPPLPLALALPPFLPLPLEPLRPRLPFLPLRSIYMSRPRSRRPGPPSSPPASAPPACPCRISLISSKTSNCCCGIDSVSNPVLVSPLAPPIWLASNWSNLSSTCVS